MAILFRKVNKITEDKVDQILSKQAEIEIFKSTPMVMKFCLKKSPSGCIIGVGKKRILMRLLEQAWVKFG